MGHLNEISKDNKTVFISWVWWLETFRIKPKDGNLMTIPKKIKCYFDYEVILDRKRNVWHRNDKAITPNPPILK